MSHKVAIATDSNSGIGKDEAARLGIFVVPMPVLLEGVTYYEGVDITLEAFYGALCSGKQVTTAQPSPQDVTDTWLQAFQQGYDEVVYIPMSSGLSSSCATAIQLAEDFNGKVLVADNHRISVPQRISVLDAMYLAQKGACAADIRRRLEENAYQSSIYIAVDTLEYLKKGGRVTAAGAAVAAVLGIRPILTIQGERLDACDKVRGMKHAQKRMIEHLREDIEQRFSNVSPERLRIAAAGSFIEAEQAQEWKRMVEEAFPGISVHYDPLTFSVGCHVGPGAAGIAIAVSEE